MAKTVIEVERQQDRFNSNKSTYYVRTDSGETYVFEDWEDDPQPVRFVRRGSGDTAHDSLTTNNYTLPRDVRRVANAVFGKSREPCASVAREPESAETVGWQKE